MDENSKLCKMNSTWKIIVTLLLHHVALLQPQISTRIDFLWIKSNQANQTFVKHIKKSQFFQPQISMSGDYPKAKGQFSDLHNQLISCWFVNIISNLPIEICGCNFSQSSCSKYFPCLACSRCDQYHCIGILVHKNITTQ